MGSLRKFSRSQERATPKFTGLTEEQLRLPVGQIVSAPAKGDFLALPLFGWVSVRPSGIPLIIVASLLMRSLTNMKARATFKLELPIYPETEVATLAVLERFGWDGRIWPRDAGWPTGTGQDEENILALMNAAGLVSTLTFSPQDKGILAQPVHVARAQGPFLMPPFAAPDEPPSEEKMALLRKLYGEPEIFYPPIAKTEPSALG